MMNEPRRDYGGNADCAPSGELHEGPPGGSAAAGAQDESLIEEPEFSTLSIEDSAEATPKAAEGPGSVVGPYKPLERIGEGGMGVVYRAEQTSPIRRDVALKIIKPGMD